MALEAARILYGQGLVNVYLFFCFLFEQLVRFDQSGKNEPIIILAFNDEIAVGALKALTDAGIRVPEQVSIAGINNNPITKFYQPSISIINLPVKEVTKHTIKSVLELASGKHVY